jgi:hypothetical protein
MSTYAAPLPALALALCACAGPAPHPADPAQFRTSDGTEAQLEHAQDVLGMFRGYHTVSAARVDLHWFTSDADQIESCHGDAECTTAEVNGYRVAAYWPDDAAPAAALSLAADLAHELCHVWYFETGESGDPDHTHTECFARPGMYQSYPGEVGISWGVALAVVGVQ